MFLKRLDNLFDYIKKTECTQYTQMLSLLEALQAMQQKLKELQDNRGIVYVIGNGGSAGIASHFSVDLLNALQIPAQTLYDSNMMTCIANDYGYDKVFQKPLDLLLRKKDLVVAISSSGSSPNIVQAAHIAKQKKVDLITFTGFLSHNPLRQLGDLNFWVNVSDYGFVEMAHFCLLHTIIDCFFERDSLEVSYASKN